MIESQLYECVLCLVFTKTKFLRHLYTHTYSKNVNSMQNRKSRNLKKKKNVDIKLLFTDVIVFFYRKQNS